MFCSLTIETLASVTLVAMIVSSLQGNTYFPLLVGKGFIMPAKLLSKVIATRLQKSQLKAAKLAGQYMTNAESEGDIVADIENAIDFLTGVKNVLKQEGDNKGHRFSKSTSTSVRDNCAAFVHTLAVGQIPTSGKQAAPAPVA